jgi:uncharacterized protein (DUF1330 family)
MAAYVIADIEIADAAAYREYGSQVGAVVEQYGGRFLARGGRIETVEGDWQPSRIVLLQFATMKDALDEYRSPEYQRLAALRHKASKSRVIIVDGV